MDATRIVSMAAVVMLAMESADAFVSKPVVSMPQKTSLNAMPPMIIGGMIRKMREEQKKKQVPLASDEEQKGEAPGLRVGGGAWKWPPVWPYDAGFFTPNEDLPPQKQDDPMSPMANALAGRAPPTKIEDTDEKVEKLDVVKYWSVEKGDVKTEMDPEAVEKLKSHFSFYLKPGMSILEFGAAEDSYLPDGLNPSRHVGVGLSTKLMEQNPSLTEKLAVDLNKVVEDRDIDSEEIRQLATGEQFDAIIMTNTIDYLTNPREVFRTAWYLLKPGGIMMVAFSNKKAFSSKFKRAQTKMWRDFNDDQHMWVAGSMFQFSAGEGWNSLKGFDISPESAKKALESGPLDAFKKGKDNNVYVVQARKGVVDEEIDQENPTKSIKSKMWMLPTMEDRDKQLVVPRLARIYTKTQNPEVRDAIVRNVNNLPTIYETLVKMDQFAFTFQMQSQLAADLASNPRFDGNEAQILALKQGLGLRKPSPEFWQPVGKYTGNMNIEDKINLLAYLVPCFGSGDEKQEQALLDFASGLEPTFAFIRSRCSDLPESDVQLLGTELLSAEVLLPGSSTREEYALWLGAMTESELREILSERKRYTEVAKADLEAYKAEQAEAARRREELKRQYDEQVKKAREERSMAFNPKSGKFENIKKEK